MAKVITVTLLCILFIGICLGAALPKVKESSICGDWTPYKDEKCIKIVDRAGVQTQADSEVICKTFANELNGNFVPKLLTIKSKEEQEFMERFLFAENEMVDHVWLGLTKNPNSKLFEWNDKSALSFNNWADQTLSNEVHECVQMESAEGAASTGLWFRVNCRRKNAVVCEYAPTLPFEALLDSFLSFKLEQDAKDKEWDQEENGWENKQKEWARNLEESEQKVAKMEKEIGVLKQQINKAKNSVLRPIPPGFIYVQFSDQSSPASLWPGTKWTEVTPTYAGLFFRAAGELQGAEFGKTQEESSPKLLRVEKIIAKEISNENPLTVPSNGLWSEYILCGGQSGGTRSALRFQATTEEVRPRNQAVKIWQRIN